MRKPVCTVTIPVAEFGTRFLLATKSQPKEMLPIVDKLTIQYIIEEAIASGIEEILIITSTTNVRLKIILRNLVGLKIDLLKR